MKKFINFLLLFFIIFNLAFPTYILAYAQEESDTNSTSEQINISDYNELYGLQPSNSKQVSLNSAVQFIKYLAVFIKFSDSGSNIHHLDDDKCLENAKKIFNSDELFDMNTEKGIVQVPSFKKYYEMQSYGSLSITTEIFPKVNGKIVAYIDSHPIGYYMKYTSTNAIGYRNKDESLHRETELINNAVGFVSSQIQSFGITASDIDTGNDGIVDAISFFVEGKPYDNISWGDLLWSHKLDNDGISNTILGKRVKPYNLIHVSDYTETASVFSLNRGTYGTILHEFGHTLGFSDLYRYISLANKPVGFYDIMGNSAYSNPSDLLTYFTSEYSDTTNWHSPLPLVDKTTQNITLYKPNYINKSEKRAIKINPGNNSKEYFIVEYHNKINTYDTYSADLSGIIVYRVNENNKYYGNSNSGLDGKSDHIFVFRPGETVLGEGKGDLTKATLNATRPILGKTFGNNTFDNNTIYYSDGSNSGIIIKVVSQTDSSVTFNVQFPEFIGNGTQNNPYLIYDVDTFLYLMQLDTRNKYYKIMNDLDFANIDYPKINFYGKLNGNNKTLKNISSTGTGVFMNIGEYNVNSTVENLNVENINVNPENGDYLGGFASIITNATLKNIHLNSGSVTNITNSLNTLCSTGGFAGSLYNTVVIDNCSSLVNVYAEKNVGGFVGINMNAIIKNSFTNGLVSGKSNVGGFIGLQCISDTSYNVPQNVYYDYSKTKVENAVGGYAEVFHNSDTLPINSLGIGIVGVSVIENLSLKCNEELNYKPTTNPITLLNFNITPSDSSVISYNNGKIKGLKNGTSKIYTNLNVGSQTMIMETNVTVTGGNVIPPIEEEIVNPIPQKPFPFVDVSRNTWYYNSVKFVYDRDIILGTSSTLFKPNNNLTRGMLVTILWRMQGSPVSYGGKSFPDVKSDQYYYSAVKWASSTGVVSGHGDGTFKPNSYITREQLAIMICNYAKYINKTGKNPVNISNFKDYKKVSNYALESVQWAVSNKIISGKENGTKIAPHGYATRAEASAMIQNYLSYIN